MVELDEHRKGMAPRYTCKCDCGNIRHISRYSLLTGNSKSCGCLNRESMVIDLTGQKFGRLTVIKEFDWKTLSENQQKKYKGKGSFWICDCDCGTKGLIRKCGDLRRGHGISCGCLNREMSHIKNMDNLVGKKFNHLTAIEEVPRDESKKSKSILWRCKCDCGNYTIVSQNALVKGGTVSCGCVVSKNEEKIKSLLRLNDIEYRSQYSFDDLRSPITGWLLKFDFGILYKGDLVCLVEYDGQQHDYPMRFCSNKEQSDLKFQKTQLYDQVKNNYCETNHIPLIRISWKSKNQIEHVINNIIPKLIEHYKEGKLNVKNFSSTSR